MENKNNDKMKKSFKIHTFNKAYEPPKNKFNDKRSIVEWGDKNLYPNYLLDLYNYKGSATHKSIINKKVKLISGNGFVEDNLSPEVLKFIKENKLEGEVKKATMDYEIFNGFAFEIIWNREGSRPVKVRHLPFHNLRVGIETEELPFEYYWYSNNWEEYRKKEYEPVWIRGFNPYVKQGKQVYYYSEYNPQSMGLYPIIGYSTTVNWIEMDFQISQFHLNQVKQGYSPSFILNFATGIPTPEEMDEFYKDFKRNYSGSENSGKIIITYSEGADGKPELVPIQLNDSDERFIMLMSQIENNIVRGHEIPLPLIANVPGKLGSSEERAELMAEFQAYYVTQRQEVVEDVLKQIFSTFTHEEIKLKRYTDNDESNVLSQ